MKKRPLFWIGTVFVLILGLLLTWKEEIFYSAALAAEDSFSDEETVRFQGKVKAIEEKEMQTIITLKDARITAGEQSYTSKGLLVYTKEVYACNPGEILCGEGKLSKITEPENPGQFNARSYYNGKKIDYRIFSAGITDNNGEKDYYLCFLAKVKAAIVSGITAVFEEKDAGILQSVLLGDKSGMDQELYSLYQLAGIAHIFAISGLHIGLAGRGIYGFLRKVGIKFAGAFWISLFLMISYGIITGQSPSAVRAIIMFGLSVFAKVCGRGYDLLTAIMVALVAVVIENPFTLHQSGLWLSFGAVLAIGLVNPCLEKCFQPVNPIWKSFLVSFSVHIFTVPVLCFSYFQFSTYGILLNLVVIPLMTFVFVSGASAGIIGIFLPAAGKFAGGMAHYILWFYDKLCQLCMQLPRAVFLTGKPKIWQIGLYYCLLFFILYGMGKFKDRFDEKICIIRKKMAGAGLLVLLAMLILVLLPLHTKGLEITMIDVGQGDGIFIQAAENEKINIFVDGGSSDVKETGKYRILPFLKSKGVNHIHKWLVTHGDSDHYSGLVEILEEVKKGQFFIDAVCLPMPENPGEGYEEICREVEQAGVLLEFVESGTIWNAGKLKLEFLHPEKNYKNESENSYSLVFLLEYDEFLGLFTGDVEGDGEECITRILGNEKPLTLLKTAHHGSKNSTTEEFCRAISPRIAFISAGVNNSYGHPSKEVLGRLKQEKCRIYNTQEKGAVWLKTDGKKVKVGWQMEK